MLNYELLTPAVDRAAGIVASNFPAHHDINDVKQTLWVWIMENRGTVSRIVADSEGTLTAVENLLVKAATTYLRKEDAQVYGYSDEDKFFYSVDLIKSILEVVFRYEDWQSFAMSQDAQPRAKSEPALGGNNLASYADVKSAVEKLPEDYYNLIVWRYKYQYTFTRIGAETGTTKQSVQERHNRAVKAVQALLGQQPLSELRGGWDGRTTAAVTRGSISRSDTAQHVVQKDYEG
jgi:DNA-directed RNA polymerase specialized sigma24 family protein